MTKDRMFHVLVAGGAALIGAATSIAGCGGDVTTQASDSHDAASEGFPSELGAPPPDGSIVDAAADHDAWPQEGPAMVDAARDTAADAHDAAAEADAFPREGPRMVDAGGG